MKIAVFGASEAFVLRFYLKWTTIVTLSKN